MLEVQELDARADQLRHQGETLPELAEIAELTAQLTQLHAETRDAQTSVEDLTAEQEKVDADVETVKARRTRDRDRMDQGLITNPKDLERMTHELVSLDRRIGDLEDAELEVMERLEEAQSGLDSLQSREAASQSRLSALIAARDEKAAAISSQLADLTADRAPLADVLPADLLALYTRLRDSKGGIGAAELRARQCGGCRLSLDNAELSAIKSAADDEVIRCEECQRILIRTAESGL